MEDGSAVKTVYIESLTLLYIPLLIALFISSLMNL